MLVIHTRIQMGEISNVYARNAAHVCDSVESYHATPNVTPAAFRLQSYRYTRRLLTIPPVARDCTAYSPKEGRQCHGHSNPRREKLKHSMLHVGMSSAAWGFRLCRWLCHTCRSPVCMRACLRASGFGFFRYGFGTFFFFPAEDTGLPHHKSFSARVHVCVDNMYVEVLSSGACSIMPKCTVFPIW